MGRANASAGAVGSRLSRAVDRRFGDVKSFQREMERRGVKGSSQGAVYSYVAGEALPRLDFLEVAADVLGVRLAWLALGEDPPTEKELEASSRRKGLKALWEEEGAKEGAYLRSLLGAPYDQVVHAETWREDTRRNAIRDARLSALLRFADKLTAVTDEVAWHHGPLRRTVLAHAASFLLGSDSLVEQLQAAARGSGDDGGDLASQYPAEVAGVETPLLLAPPESSAELSQWYDAVLHAYSLLVPGLGAPMPTEEPGPT